MTFNKTILVNKFILANAIITSWNNLNVVDLTKVVSL